MDGYIARLVCTGTVITRESGEDRAGALTEGVLRMELPAALPGALELALADDPAVYLVRSLRCDIRTVPAVTGSALARSIAAQVVRTVRDPDSDGTALVRFSSVADYLAAFLAALVHGEAWDRWYFRPLRRFAHRGLPEVFRALHAEEGSAMTGVLLALNRSGDLGPVLSAVGEDALAHAWPPVPGRRPQQAEWLSLVRLGIELARALGWEAAAHQDLAALAAGLAESADTDIDWSDPVGLAHALVRAVRLVAAPAASAYEVAVDQLPTWVDWADTGTLLQGLRASASAPPAAQQTGLQAPVAIIRSPRRLAIDVMLAEVVSRGVTVPDPAHRTASSIALWAALVDRMPELAGVGWARDAVRQFVDQWLDAQGTSDPPGADEASAGVARRATDVDTACAGVYLLLRTLDAMRMPSLCRRAAVPAGPLLQMLAWRWAGPVVGPEEVAGALRPILGGPAAPGAGLTADSLRSLQGEVAHTVAAQHRTESGVVRLRSVPFGAAAMAWILGDADDLVWWAGRLQDPGAGSGALLEWWRQTAGGPPAAVERPAGDADDPGREALLASLAAVAHAHSGDPQVDLSLDLIALTVLREWARWLRGFSRASLPYLLATFIRRTGRLVVAADGGLRVDLDGLPHDVVLDLSRCLAPFEPRWPWAAQPAASETPAVAAPGLPPALVRRIEFTVGS